MSDSGWAERPVLTTVPGPATALPESDDLDRRPHPSEARAMYAIAARLAELQLELAEQSSAHERDLAATRDALRNTHRVVFAAIEHVERARTAAGPGPDPSGAGAVLE
jgi:hypothetical protein